MPVIGLTNLTSAFRLGSTDSHSGIAFAEESNFWGKLAVDSIPENTKRSDDSDGYADAIQSWNSWNIGPC